MKRRTFIKQSLFLASGMLLSKKLLSAEDKQADVIQVSGDSPYLITRRAIQEAGGMKKYVARGDIVMVKPNIAWNRSVELASNTNPEVVKAIVEEAYNAGAKKVIVMDNTCHKAEESYRTSGIAQAAKEAGAEVRFVDENRLVTYNFKGEIVKNWPVFKDFLEVDKFINVPILKSHGIATLTIALKNLMGIVGGNRGKIHREIGMQINDLAAGFKNDLIIVDAYRVLLRKGPVGSNPDDVALKKTVFISKNIYLADLVAAAFMNYRIEEVSSLAVSLERGLIPDDPGKVALKVVQI